MKVLVAAASEHGATAEIATTIGEVLAERGLDTTVASPEEVDSFEGYDAAVLGSAVYAGHWLKPARELVDRLDDERAVATALRVPEGDFRDWTGIRAWAASIAEAIQTRPAPSANPTSTT